MFGFAGIVKPGCLDSWSTIEPHIEMLTRLRKTTFNSWSLSCGKRICVGA
jgi:hypothetical protein